MSTWIALMRGIGGGFRPLPMKELARALEELGLENVRTYIQSGNVIFTSPRAKSAVKLAARIKACVTENFGYDSDIIVLTPEDLEQAVADNPYRKAVSAPTTLHLYFMQDPPPAPRVEELVKWKAEDEAYALHGRVFYLHTPRGPSQSKMVGKIERLLGVPATARNWRTVTTVLELARQ